jgi:hypothetical protein
VTCDACVVAGAAQDEAPHAVAEEHELVDRHRPSRQRRLESVGEVAAVERDVPAAVVAQVQRRKAVLALKRKLTLTRPVSCCVWALDAGTRLGRPSPLSMRVSLSPWRQDGAPKAIGQAVVLRRPETRIDRVR